MFLFRPLFPNCACCFTSDLLGNSDEEAKSAVKFGVKARSWDVADNAELEMYGKLIPDSGVLTQTTSDGAADAEENLAKALVPYQEPPARSRLPLSDPPLFGDGASRPLLRPLPLTAAPMMPPPALGTLSHAASNAAAAAVAAVVAAKAPEVMPPEKLTLLEDLVKKLSLEAWQGRKCTVVQQDSGMPRQAICTLDQDLRHLTLVSSTPSGSNKTTVSTIALVDLRAVVTFEATGVYRSRHLSEPVRRAAKEGQWASMLVYIEDPRCNVALLEDHPKKFAIWLRTLQTHARWRDFKETLKVKCLEDEDARCDTDSKCYTEVWCDTDASEDTDARCDTDAGRDVDAKGVTLTHEPSDYVVDDFIA